MMTDQNRHCSLHGVSIVFGLLAITFLVRVARAGEATADVVVYPRGRAGRSRQPVQGLVP